MDEHIRQLEKLAAQGDPAAIAALARARQRLVRPWVPRATPIPSATTLQRIVPGHHRETALRLRRLLDERDEPENYESVQTWIRQCYHRPRGLALVLEAANEILEGHGVEAIRCQGDARLHGEYINFGGSYVETLIYDHDVDRFLVWSWGDFVERAERRCRECRTQGG